MLNEMQRWSRSARMAVYAGAAVGCFLIAFGIIFAVVLLGNCESPQATCSSGTSAAFVVSLMAWGLASVRSMQALGEYLNLWGDDSDVPEPQPTSAVPDPKGTDPASLGMGQYWLVGVVESVQAQRRTVKVNGLLLRFWSNNGLSRGFLKSEDRVSLVYQQLPLAELRYVLAFSTGCDSRVRTVAATGQAAVLALGLLGVVFTYAHSANLPGWLFPLSLALVAITSSYLALLVIARRALQQRVGIELPPLDE